MSSPLALVLAAMVAGPLSALPPPDQTEVMVPFRPDVTEQQVYAAITEVDGRISF